MGLVAGGVVLVWGWAPEFIWGPLFLCQPVVASAAVVCRRGVFLSGVALCYPRGVIKEGEQWVTMGPCCALGGFAAGEGRLRGGAPCFCDARVMVVFMTCCLCFRS